MAVCLVCSVLAKGNIVFSGELGQGNVLHRLVYLNMWSPVWRGYGSCRRWSHAGGSASPGIEGCQLCPASYSSLLPVHEISLPAFSTAVHLRPLEP